MESRRSITNWVGPLPVICFTKCFEFFGGIFIIGRTVIRTAKRCLEIKAINDVEAGKYTAGQRNPVYNILNQCRKGNRIQDLIVLIVVANSPITITKIVERTILIVNRPHRVIGQCRLNYTATTISTGSIYTM